MWLMSRRLVLGTGVSGWGRAYCALRLNTGSIGNVSTAADGCGHKLGVMRFITDDAKLDADQHKAQREGGMPNAAKQSAEFDPQTDTTHRRYMEALTIFHGQQKVMDASTAVVQCVQYAAEKYRDPGASGPTIVAPDPGPLRQLQLLLEDTLFKPVVQDMEDDINFDEIFGGYDFRVELDDTVQSGHFRRHLECLDCDVQVALMYDIPALEAWRTDVGNAIRMLRTYESKVRPLLVAALGGDEGPKGDGDRGLQAAVDEDVGDETSSRV